MSDWIGIVEAQGAPGLKLALFRGFPSPWSVAARWIFDLKRVPYLKVERTEADAAENRLRQWTGQDSLPVAVLDDERPRSHWSAIALLAERLGPEPRLIPDDPVLRADMMGLAHELMGEMGLLWCVRALALAPAIKAQPDDLRMQEFASKYGMSETESAVAPQRIRDCLQLLAERARGQRAAGCQFLVGDQMSLLDIYWAAASVLLQPDDRFALPEPVLAMVEGFSGVAGPISPDLVAMRDFMFTEHFELPLRLD
ncbi:MAG: hypothetical protein QNJ40_26460 [Xanthomonadales bacterium]|nr:hypothetical protein [Xanthomonadales bacterium]